MTIFNSPKIEIVKTQVPTIYLDTNILIELSKYKKGVCKDTNCSEIGRLYDTMVATMKSNQIVSIYGNQFEEMAVGKDREEAREFLYHITNTFYLNPYEIENKQIVFGYNSFMKQTTEIKFHNEIFISENHYIDSSVFLHIPPIYNDRKLQKEKEEKKELAKCLNDIKKSDIVKSYESQLKKEFEADFQVFRIILEQPNNPLDTILMLDELGNRFGIDFINESENTLAKFLESYIEFLRSRYHHNLPYKYIQAVLWAHIMCRSNKVNASDKLDIMWASAYLPFVNYAVTDTSFCRLLNESGIAELFGVKVYCISTLTELLDRILTDTNNFNILKK